MDSTTEGDLQGRRAVVFTFSVLPERADEAIALINETLDAMRAEEPGTIAYFFHQRVDKPGSFVTYEHYPNAGALDVHAGGPLMKAVGSRLQALFTEPGKGFLLEPVAGFGF